MQMVCTVLETLKEQLIAFLFRHSHINVVFNKMRMFSHICQSPKDLVSTSLAQEWLGEITVTKICATHCQSLTQGIVAIFPLINGVTRQVGCPFTLIVGSNHGVQRRCINTATHTILSDATQEIKNVSFGG